MADKLNSIPKIVFSNTLKKAPWGKWPEAKVAGGDAVQTIKQLKELPGKEMVLWGSISLSQHLIKANLIDEYHIRIVPVILGRGVLQFDDCSQINLQLFENKKYPSGLVLIKYKLAN